MNILILSILTTAMCVDDNRVITTLKYSKYRVKPTIVNGDPVEITRVPYIVSIKVRNQLVERERWLWRNLCGGSIIGNYKVLTAAHCFEANKFYFAKNHQTLRVVAGEIRSEVVHSGDTESTDYSQWRKIKKIIINNNFIFPNNDIALVFVSEQWRFSQSVSFISTATRTTDYPDTCFSAGYGKVNDDLISRDAPSLLLARIKVLPRWQCSVLWEMNMNSFICTDSTFGDVARGDSGGPLACRAIGDVKQAGDEVLVGVVSGKNYDKTTLYTRVSAYHDWIQRDSAQSNALKSNEWHSQITAPMFIIIPILTILIYLLFLLNRGVFWSVKEIND